MGRVFEGKDLRFGLPPDVADEIEEAGLADLAENCYFLYQQAVYRRPTCCWRCRSRCSVRRPCR